MLLIIQLPWFINNNEGGFLMKKWFSAFLAFTAFIAALTLLPSPAFAKSPHIPDHYHSGRWVEVDISAQKAYLWIDQQLQAEHQVSTGKNNNTPIGEFFIDYQRQSQKMNGKPVRWVSYISARNIAFHNTQWDLTIKMGKPRSNGCIRMYTEGAHAIYDFVQTSRYQNGKLKRGTPVCIHK